MMYAITDAPKTKVKEYLMEQGATQIKPSSVKDIFRKVKTRNRTIVCIIGNSIVCTDDKGDLDFLLYFYSVGREFFQSV